MDLRRKPASPAAPIDGGPTRPTRAQSRWRLPALVGGLAALFFPITVVAAMLAPDAPLTGASSPAPSATHYVPSVLSGLSLTTLVGAAPASHVMNIGVSVQLPNAAGESQLYSEMYDPSSPEYRDFLTPAQFDQEFGASQAQDSAITNWLTSAGLSIETSTPAGDYFTASGTVAQLDHLFNVSIGTYSYKGADFLANNVPPSVPVDLPVDAIVGLNTFQTFSVAPLTGATSGASNPYAGVPPVGPQAGTQETLTPQDLWGIYDDPGAAALTNANGTSTASTLESSTTDLGQGQTMGIFGEGQTSSVVAQLRLFEAAMGFPKIRVRTVNTEGGPESAYGDNTPTIEWYLDSQASTGMAPDASQLDFYFAKSLYDTDVFADFSDWADDPNGPREMNASFGECEADPSDPVTGPLAQVPYGTEIGDELQSVGDPMLEQATMEGRTLFSSAGDTGSGCPEVVVPVLGGGNGVAVQPVPDVSYPCASVYVVCVGGTVVSVNGASYPDSAQRTDETSWTFSGGGSSYYIPEPSYQQGVANINHPCVSTPQGDPYPAGSEPICRGVPDVSDLSGNIIGDAYFIYSDGAPSEEGGTSLASPLMMGQWARVQAGAPSKVQKKDGGLGFADPTIYKQASSADTCSSLPTATAAQTAACTSSSYTRDFYNVTTSEFGAGNGAYQPGPGWNYASGWGALNVANFITDVDQNPSDAAVERYRGTEVPARVVNTASLSGPAGWATDPVDVSAPLPSSGLPLDNQTTNQDPSLEITGATLSASSTTVTATLTGPYLGSLPSADATNGNSYYVAWEYQGVVYYAQADESPTGAWTYSSGTTQGGSYSDTSGSKATGSVNTGTTTITISLPSSEVASPPVGALLLDPQAFDQLDVGASVESLNLTTDSADDLVPPAQYFTNDCQKGTNLCGVKESQGVDVLVSAS
jgi:pseudomonalisin